MANLSDIITPTNLVTLTGTDTLTNKTLTAPVLTNATGSLSSPILTTPNLGTPSALVLTNATGTLTSPTFVTPALGTPASGVMTSVTGLPLTTGVTGTLPAANGGTGITAAGTSGNVLTSTGSAWASTAPAGGGSWVLLGTYTPSGASTVDITNFSSTYDDYAIVGTLTAGSAAPRIRIRIGSTWGTTAEYSDTFLNYNSFTSNGSGDGINMGGDIGSGADNTSIKMSFITYAMNVNESTYHGVYGQTNNAVSYYMNGLLYSGYYYGSAGAASGILTGLRYYPSSGTYTGTVRIYGIVK